MVAYNIPYSVQIEDPTEFDGIRQRAQVSAGEVIYDISWDETNQRVICVGPQQVWYEIRHDTVESTEIELIDVLNAFNLCRDNTEYILNSPLHTENTIDNYLVTPICADFLMQMDIATVSDDDPSPTASDDDPSPTSSDNESIECDSDDPILDTQH